MDQDITFIKLGGSLITDKRKRETPRPHLIASIAKGIRRYLDQNTNSCILIGHGSGSYGHWEATQYDTRTGVSTPHQWRGFARVSATASRLNRIVIDIFLKAGVPVLSLQPSASINTQSGIISEYNIQNIQHCFIHNLIPVIYGDVAFDQSLGGTIVSTEDIFSFLTPVLNPSRIILLGNSPGVYDNQQQIINQITPQNYPEIKQFIHGSKYTDVTGGMADKVRRMVSLVEKHPNLKINIMSGRQADDVVHALMGNTQTPGTIISLI
jgi:isopentenyl phosphate kinase